MPNEEMLNEEESILNGHVECVKEDAQLLTEEGELIQVADAAGAKAFLKDTRGNAVKSRLNENLLKQVASAAGGAYVKASGSELGLDFLYREYIAKLQKRELDAQAVKLYHERFQIPLGVALLVLLIEPWLAYPWRMVKAARPGNGLRKRAFLRYTRINKT